MVRSRQVKAQMCSACNDEVAGLRTHGWLRKHAHGSLKAAGLLKGLHVGKSASQLGPAIGSVLALRQWVLYRGGHQLSSSTSCLRLCLKAQQAKTRADAGTGG